VDLGVGPTALVAGLPVQPGRLGERRLDQVEAGLGVPAELAEPGELGGEGFGLASTSVLSTKSTKTISGSAVITEKTKSDAGPRPIESGSITTVL